MYILQMDFICVWLDAAEKDYTTHCALSLEATGILSSHPGFQTLTLKCFGIGYSVALCVQNLKSSGKFGCFFLLFLFLFF